MRAARHVRSFVRLLPVRSDSFPACLLAGARDDGRDIPCPEPGTRAVLLRKVARDAEGSGRNPLKS